MSFWLHISLYTSLHLPLYIDICTYVFFHLYISHGIFLFLLISIYSFGYVDISLYIFPSAYISVSPLYKSQVLPPKIFFYMNLLSSVLVHHNPPDYVIISPWVFHSEYLYIWLVSSKIYILSIAVWLKQYLNTQSHLHWINQ